MATKAEIVGQPMHRLPPDVTRVLLVRNLPYNIKGDELYELFGKFGAIRQVRIGNAKDTKGTAFVVFEDIYDAKNAQEHLTGYNVHNRYIHVLFYNMQREIKKKSLEQEEAELRKLQEKYGVDGQQHPTAAAAAKK